MAKGWWIAKLLFIVEIECRRNPIFVMLRRFSGELWKGRISHCDLKPYISALVTLHNRRFCGKFGLESVNS